MKKRSQQHFQWIVIGAVVVGVGVFALSKTGLSTGRTQEQTATMVIHFSQDHKRTFEGQTVNKMTILEALYASTNSGEIRFVYTIDNNDVKIAAINDELTNTGNKQWNFYLNGSIVKTEDLNKIFISPRDTIEAKFE